MNGINNGRIYGASFTALKNMLESYGFHLVHISGFCNLIFLSQDFMARFAAPDAATEITDSDEKVMRYAETYCTANFVPSWLKFSPLNRINLGSFKH